MISSYKIFDLIKHQKEMIFGQYTIEGDGDQLSLEQFSVNGEREGVNKECHR